MVKKIGFTGTQAGMSGRQAVGLATLLYRVLTNGEEFHHGMCKGADANAHFIATAVYKVIGHPPIKTDKMMDTDDSMVWFHEKRVPKDYLDRDQDIVDECDVLIATPRTREEELRSGTWATIRRARKAGKPVFILWP